MTLVTSIGDFLTLFASIRILDELGYPVTTQAFVVVLKALSIVLGAFLLPIALNRHSTKKVLFVSQALSFVTATIFVLAYAKGHVGLWAVYAFNVLNPSLKQLFDGARETHSKNLGEDAEQRSFVASLLSGYYIAQVFGPILAFVLLWKGSPVIPLAIDAASFLVTALFSLRLTLTPSTSMKITIFRPLSYLGKRPDLRKILLLRSVGFWIPNSLFNFLLFSVVTEHYKLDAISSAFVYSAIGLGAALSALSFNRAALKTLIDKVGDSGLAFLAHAALATCMLLFLKLNSFSFALLATVAYGVFMAINAVCTQHLRRVFTSAIELPEIIGLEIVLARSTDFTVAQLTKTAIEAHQFKYAWGLWLSAGLFLVTGLLYLQLNRNPVKLIR
jgi:hypothetical protein